MSETQIPPETLASKPPKNRNSGVQNPKRRALFRQFFPKGISSQEETEAHPLAITQKSDADKQTEGISRRAFLKGIAAGVAVTALPNLDKILPNQDLNPETGVEMGEVLRPSDRAVFVDMAPNFDNRGAMQNLLDDLYAPPEILDLDSPNTRANISNLIATEDDRVVATLLANEVLKSREGHGEVMGGKYVKTITDLGYEAEVPAILPLQEAFSNVEFGRDELGNPWIIMETDEEKIGDALEHHFNENPDIRCVNLSLQIGRARTKQVLRQVIPLQKTNEFEIYDEATDTEFVTVATDIHSWAVAPDGRFLPHRMVDGVLTPLRDDELLTTEQYQETNHQHEQQIIPDYQAGRPTDQIEEVFRNETTEMYNSEFARENLPRLIALCRRFPDKLFSVSGGNENSFFYDIRQEMEVDGQWADNLIISAEKRTSQGSNVEVAADGADVYLEPYRFNKMAISSSEAAARVSALGSILTNQGASNEEAKSRIINDFCVEDTYITTGNIERTGRVLDPSLYTQALSSESAA